ncbi:MAG: pyridoxamine 5'-phosphate oxidase family protein [Nocardioides sp.]
MAHENIWTGGRLIELTTQECWELLASRPVGRIAYDDGEGPVVLPVNHLVCDGTIRFRTAPHSTLASHVHGHRVAFQLDDVEEFHTSGWSVLVRGRAVLADLDLHGEVELTTWVAGNRQLVVEITPTEVTGRRLIGN